MTPILLQRLFQEPIQSKVNRLRMTESKSLLCQFFFVCQWPIGGLSSETPNNRSSVFACSSQAVGSFVNTSSSGSGTEEGVQWLLGVEQTKNRIIRFTGNKGGQWETLSPKFIFTIMTQTEGKYFIVLRSFVPGKVTEADVHSIQCKGYFSELF